MSKAKSPNFENASKAVKVMPSGAAVPPGGSVHVSADDKKHPVVAAWIKDHVIVPLGSRAKTTATPGDADTKALAGLTTERDTAVDQLARAAEAWRAVEASLVADEGSDDAKALEDRIAALNGLLPPVQ